MCGCPRLSQQDDIVKNHMKKWNHNNDIREDPLNSGGEDLLK